MSSRAVVSCVGFINLFVSVCVCEVGGGSVNERNADLFETLYSGDTYCPKHKLKVIPPPRVQITTYDIFIEYCTYVCE